MAKRTTVDDLKWEIHTLTERVYELEMQEKAAKQVVELTTTVPTNTADPTNTKDLMQHIGVKMNERVVESSARFIEEVDKMVRNRLENHVAQILGFTNQWQGKWEVDHCNGRMTTIAEYVSQRAKNVITTQLDLIMSDEAVIKCIQEAKAGAITELKNSISYQLKEQLKLAISTVCSNYVQGVVSEVEKNLKTMTTEIDIADPNVDRLQEVLLKQIVESIQVAS
jgi:hypothetical protein